MIVLKSIEPLGGRRASSERVPVGPSTLVVKSALQLPAAGWRRWRAGPNHEENAGMTSVPMSSIVCITDSWEIL